MINWKYKRKTIKSLDDFPEGSFGFVYKITNLSNNKIYIGKKNLYHTRKQKLGKKALKKQDGRKSKYKTVKKESDWKSYCGSCKPLLEDIKNGDKIKREILLITDSKQKLTYYEVKFQFINEVLENDSYNSNILGRFYPKIFEK